MLLTCYRVSAASSRDWAAKGAAPLGVMAVIAESYERIPRSYLVGTGVIPFEFTGDDTRKSLELAGERETYLVVDIRDAYKLGNLYPDRFGIGFKDFLIGGDFHGSAGSIKS